jgi:hypothetical protein
LLNIKIDSHLLSVVVRQSCYCADKPAFEPIAHAGKNCLPTEGGIREDTCERVSRPVRRVVMNRDSSQSRGQGSIGPYEPRKSLIQSQLGDADSSAP